MTKMYAYNGQITSLSDEQAANFMATYEKSLQSGVAYVGEQAFPSQIDDIKAWPNGVPKDFLRETAVSIAGSGSPISMPVLRKAIIATGKKLAELRAAKSGRSIESEWEEIAGETALATIFRRALDVDIIPKSRARKYADNGKSMRVVTRSTTTTLYVNVDERESADIFVRAIFLTDIGIAYLLGYATQADVKAAPIQAGGKFVQIPIEKLRPMGSLYAECGLKELPGGVSMESVPDQKLLPVLLKKDLQALLTPETNDFDMLAELGISEPKEPAKAPKVPTQQL